MGKRVIGRAVAHNHRRDTGQLKDDSWSQLDAAWALRLHAIVGLRYSETVPDFNLLPARRIHTRVANHTESRYLGEKPTPVEFGHGQLWRRPIQFLHASGQIGT